MTSKTYPTDVLAQTQAVIEAWKKIDPDLTIGDLTTATVGANLEQAKPIQVELDSLDAQMTSLRNRRDDLFAQLWDEIKRARNGVKGIYGDDSSEYEMIGGKRISERKPGSIIKSGHGRSMSGRS